MGASQFIAISSLSGRCKTSYRTLKPFQMPSRTFRQSRQRSRRAAAARQDRPARTIGRFFRVKRCFSAQVDIQIRTSTTRHQERLPRRVRGRPICCRSIKDRCRRLKRHPQGWSARHPTESVGVRPGNGRIGAILRIRPSPEYRPVSADSSRGLLEIKY